MASLPQWLKRVVEKNSQEAPDASELRGWGFYAAVQIGVTISVPFFIFGGQLSQHESFGRLVPGVLLGALLGATWSAVTGHVGLRARRPTAILIRRTFGALGAQAITALLILISFGWFGIQTEMLSSSVNTLLRASLGVEVSGLLITVVVGVLICSTAMIGYKALGRISYVSVPLLLMAIVAPLVMGLRRHGLGPIVQSHAVAAPYSLGMIISIVGGADMFGSAVNPDLTRFLRTPRDNALAMIVSMAIAFPALLLLAAALALTWRTADLVSVMVQAGVALPGLFVVVLATWTSNDRNLYASALALSAVLPGVDRWLLALGAGVFGTMLAAAHLLGHLLDWLVFLGILAAPMAGVYVADFVLDRGEYDLDHPAPRLRPAPVACWLAGAATGVATLPKSAMGLGLLQLTTVPTLDALLGGSLAYVAFALARRRLAAGAAPA